MKYAIISDIHGNLDALTTVIKHAKEKGADGFICLGDIIGYGAEPNECIAAIQDLECKYCVMGNHDLYASSEQVTMYFNQVARKAIEWTRNQLTDDNLAWVRSLPYIEHDEDFTVVHSSPHNYDDFNYIMSAREAFLAFSVLKNNLCFIGHSHTPLMVVEGEKCSDPDNPYGHKHPIFHSISGKVKLSRYGRVIINVGSVGQPRDHDKRASFCIYDNDKKELKLHRVSYDIESASKKILEAGLPPFLAERIKAGQ
jgi:diadenosine tetraphosphatase ApaH/serine/threonine PP2A family protein phosphatase